MDMRHAQNNERIRKVLELLRKDYIFAKSERVDSWSAWVVIGVAVGISAAAIFVSGRGGKIEPSHAASETHQASLEFSGTQTSSSGWQYLNFVGGSLLAYHASHPDCGNEACWKSGNADDRFHIVARYYQHPGVTDYPTRRWKTAVAGTATLSSTTNVRDANASCGDGVNVYITKNKQNGDLSSPLWSRTIANGNTTGYPISSIPAISMNASDWLDFIVTKGSGNSDCDATYFDPIITFTHSGGTPPASGTGEVKIFRINASGSLMASTRANVDALVGAASARFDNPAYWTGITAGGHGAHATDLYGHTESVGFCYAPLAGDCTVTTFSSPPGCSAGDCNSSIEVKTSQIVKVVYKYTTSPSPLPRVFLHYQTWYDRGGCPAHGPIDWQHWTYGREPCEMPRTSAPWLRSVGSVSYPLIGPWNGQDEEVIRWDIRNAKRAGIDTFVGAIFAGYQYSWNGFEKLLKIGYQEGIRLAIDGWWPAPEKKDAWKADVIKQIDAFFFNSPYKTAIAKLGGKPVYYIQGNGLLNGTKMSEAELIAFMDSRPVAWMIESITPQQAKKFNTSLTQAVAMPGIVFNRPTGTGCQFPSTFSKWTEEVHTASLPLVVEGVAGFDTRGKLGTTKHLLCHREDGRTLERLLQAAVEAKADVISFDYNDFAEGQTAPGFDERAFDGTFPPIYGSDPFRYLKIIAKFTNRAFQPLNPPCVVVDPLLLIHGKTSCTSGWLDKIPPAAPGSLTGTLVGSTQVRLDWSAPGDDNMSGRAARYDVRYIASPRSNDLTHFGTISESLWAKATQVFGEPGPLAVGTKQSMTVGDLPSTVDGKNVVYYYFAIKVIDEAGNNSVLATVAVKR